eukprot:NODE_111_length_19413_cov_0.323703.p12 type:complete len:118 gc:universal NODE_111_length_19413_cov_0.323703:13109-12756(-)
MASLPLISGLSITICLSNLPGRISAASNTSGLFVPANTTTCSLSSNPSISTKSWFNVDSLSSLPPNCAPLPLALPIASISSRKIMQGVFFLALSNRSRTRALPTPTNISTNSDPLTE